MNSLLSCCFREPSKFKYRKKENLPRSRKVQWVEQRQLRQSIASWWEAPDSIVTRDKIVNVLSGPCILFLQKWNQLRLGNVSEFMWELSEALPKGMQCRGQKLSRAGHGQALPADKGYLWSQASLSILCLSFTLGPPFSHPLKQPAPLCPVSSVPVISELSWKVQVANDLMPPIESCVQCPFIEYEAVLIKWVKKFTFSRGRFSWFLMVEF